MATSPFTCNKINFEGVVMQRCNLQVISGIKILEEVSFCDINIRVKLFSVFKGCINPKSSLLLNGSELGEIAFILVKVIYPSSFNSVDKYITVTYKEKSFPVSNLMILTGTPKKTIGQGWDLNNNNMKLNNPHSVKINVEVIIASGIYGEE